MKVKTFSFFLVTGIFMVFVFLSLKDKKTNSFNEPNTDHAKQKHKIRPTTPHNNIAVLIPNHSNLVNGEIDIEAAIVGRPFAEWVNLLEEFVKHDPVLCAKTVNLVSDKSNRTTGLQIIARFWGRLDFDAAKHWMSENLTESEFLTMQQPLISGLINGDTERAKKVVLETEAPFIKQQLALSLVHALYLVDPVHAEDWAVKNLSPIQSSQALEMIGREFARSGNMDEAIRLSSKMVFGLSRDNFLAFIGTEYAKKDLVGALSWYNSLEENDRAATQPYVMATWAESAPVEAANYSFTTSANTTEIGNVMSVWAVSSPTDAAAWINEKYGIGKETKELMGRVMQEWGRSDPSAAATYVAGLPPGKERGSYLTLIASNWAGSDPAAAGKFLSALDGDDSISAVRLLVNVWGSLDSLNASKWVASLEQGQKYDAASAVLAERIYTIDPRGGAEWAAAIGEASTRQKTLAKVFEGLGKQMGEGAFDITNDLNLNNSEMKIVNDAIGRGKLKK